MTKGQTPAEKAVVAALQRDMASIKTSIANLEARPTTASTQPTPTPPAQTSRSTWLQANWIGLLTLIAAVIALLVAVIAILAGYYQWWLPRHEQKAESDLGTLIDRHLDDKFKQYDLEGLKTDVGTIKGQMTVFIPLLQSVVQKELKTLSSLPPGDLQKHLPEVNAALATAKIVHADLTASVVADVQSKLVQLNRQTPYFWEVASSLIQYRSVVLPNNLPNCLDKPPVVRTAQAIPGHIKYPYTLKVTNPTYEDCKIDLGASPSQDVIYLLHQLPGGGLECRQCLVIYDGGAVPLLNYTRKLMFVNCAFQITTHGVPSEPGRKLIDNLLAAQNLANVKFDNGAGLSPPPT